MSSLKDVLINVLNIHKQNVSSRSEKLNKHKFNVFSILHVEYKETRHSAFLTELLNPRGSHKMGDAFLRLFYKKLGLSDVDDFSKIVVSREFVTRTGIIDIYIKADKPENSIIIENKIYARDQDGQLARYHTFDPSAKLVYLTLDGHYASDQSLVCEEANCHLTVNDYERISYVDFIIDWIEQCHTIAMDNASVREILGQYIDLLKVITKHTLNQDEKMKIAEEVTKDQDSVMAFLLMIQNSSEIYKQLSKPIRKEIDKVVEKLNITLRIVGEDGKEKKDGSSLSEKYTYLNFEFDSDSEYCPLIGFEKENFTDILFGIACKVGKEGRSKEKMVAAFEEKYPGARHSTKDISGKPFVHLSWDDHCNLCSEKFSSIYDGSFAADLEKLLLCLKDVIKIGYSR